MKEKLITAQSQANPAALTLWHKCFQLLCLLVFAGQLSASGSAPRVDRRLVSQLIPRYGYVTLESGILGTAPMHRQWFLNGEAILLATNVNLTLTDLEFADTGNYSVVTTNQFGSVTNGPVRLTVSEALVWSPFSVNSNLLSVPLDATNLVHISASQDHILALRADGSPIGWGKSTGLATLPANATNISKVFASEIHSMVLNQDGQLTIWNAASNLVQVPSRAIPAVHAAIGGSFAGTITGEGKVVLWNLTNANTAVRIPESTAKSARLLALKGTQIEDSFLVLRQDGALVGWRQNKTQTNWLATHPTPAVLAKITNACAFDAYGYAGIALAANGRVATWTFSSSLNYTVPSEVTNIVAVAVAGGSTTFFALRNDGRLFSWGLNRFTVSSNTFSAVEIGEGPNTAFATAIASDGSPRFVDQLGDLTANRGSDFSLNALVVGKPPLSYQWQFNGEDIVGATEPILTITNIQDEATGGYSVIVSNTMGTASGEVANLLVEAPFTVPSIINQPESLVIDAGSEAVFSVTATGWPHPTYQWQSNNVNIVGATNTTYMILLAHTNHVANYRVIASNFEGSVTSQVATVTVELTPRPAFVSWPADQSASLGQNRTLGVQVTGSEPITYRWQRNGVDIPNANGPNLFLNELSLLEHGIYRVVVSNEFGVVTGPEFRMDVAPLIAWGRNAKGQTNLPPDLLDTVAVAAGNQHALALQANGSVVAWGDNEFEQSAVPLDLTNAVAIAAGHQFSLALRSDGTVVGWGANDFGQINIPASVTNVIAIDAGFAFGYALRADGTVVVWGFNNQGQRDIPEAARDIVAIKAGSAHLLALRADGQIITWGYLHNGLGNIPNTATNVVALAAGSYHNIVLKHSPNGHASWSSGSMPVSHVNYSPSVRLTIYSALRPLAMATSQHVTLAVSEFREFLIYSTSSIPGDPRNASPRISGMQSQLAVSPEFNLLLVETAGPIVTPQVASRVAYEGGMAVFNALGHGEVRCDYQWRFNGENLPGQTNVHLVLKNVQPGQAGEYSVIKSHGGGSSTGAVTRLEVVAPALPEIALHPVSQSVPIGTNVTFSAMLKAGSIGWPQWQFNGEDIPGATNLSLTITRLQPEHEGDYQVVFANVTGSFTSLVATLTLTPTAPYIVSQPHELAVTAGGAALFQVEAYGSLPLAYQWRFNGVDILEANTSTLFLTNIQPANVGHYSVVVTNDLGSVTSAEAKLVITPAFGVGNNAYGQLDLPIGASNLVSLAAGQTHVLGLRADGQVLAWGNNDCNKATVPAGVSNIIRVAAGEIHSLALRNDGQVFGWGSVPLLGDLNNIVEIAAGSAHGLALRGDGTVQAWGKYNHVGETNVPAGLTNVVAISAGSRHNLALKQDGSLVAWGALNGVPAAATNVITIASGFAFNVALRADGQLVVWGYLVSNPSYYSVIVCSGASFIGNSVEAQLVEVPAAATNIVSIAAGRYHIVALRADGAVITWGANDSGQLDLPQSEDVFAVVAGGNVSFTLQGDLSPRFGYWADERSTGETRPTGLTSAAVGRSQMAYQWQFAGQDIPGATNAFYYLPEPRPENAGDYTLIVTNFSGSATATVSLTITSQAPVFVSHPVTNQLAVIGDTVTFSAEAKGTLPMTYRWQHAGTDLVNGPDVSGADTPTLTLSNVTAQNNGWYILRATNSAGWGVSSQGVLHVLTREPLVEALDGQGLIWRIGGPSGWHWQNGVSHDGTDAAETGPFLTDQTNWVETTVVGPVTVHFWWKFTGWIADRVSFSVDDKETVAFNNDFDWQRHSYDVPVGEHTLRWTLDADPYAGTSTLWLDEVMFGDAVPITIVTQPASRSAGAGASTTFSVGLTGSMPYLYQWQYGETNLFGATNATLTLSNLQLADAGQYRVIVSNSQGEVFSQPASLAVTSAIPGVRIVGNSPYTNIFSAAFGTDTMLSAVVTGQTPFSLQWQFERQNLPGQTGSTLIISNVQPDKLGMYRVAVSNQFGLSYSAEVELDLVPVAAWGLNDQSQLNVPFYIDSPFRVMQVGAANDFGLVAQTNGQIYSWGMPNLPLYNLTELESFALGSGHIVAVRTNGATYSYGLPMTAPVLSNVVAVAAGAQHQLALYADGSVVAWGNNESGQSAPPADATNLVALAGGEFFSLGLRVDGTVMGWGTNDHGQLDFPVHLTNVVAISAGYQHGLALRDDGTVVTWGMDTNQITPEGLGVVVAVAAGQYHNLALKQDGTVITWGSTIPELNYIWPTLTNVTGLAGGRAHSLALVGDGTPSITLQPRLRETGVAGQSKLQVMAVGGGVLGYQWQRNGMDVPDATSSVLLVDENTLGGTYSVTVSNTLGFVTSNGVFVEGPLPVLLFDSISLGEDGLHLRLSGFSGPGPVVIYSSSDLVGWEPVLTNTPTAGVLEFTDPDVTGASARFYQAVQE